MTVLIIIISAILIITLSRAIYLKKATRSTVIIGTICIVLIVVRICSVIIFKSETVSTEVIDKISSISWDDDEYLYQLGFVEYSNRTIAYDELVDPVRTKWGYSHFNIYVEKIDKETAVKKYGMKIRDDVLMTYAKSGGYDNMFAEFVCYSEIASRYYRFYLNDRLISVYDCNSKNTDRLFEQYIMNL